MYIIEYLITNLLNERIEKRDNKYYLVSHNTGNIFGKKDGYKNKRSAARAMLGAHSRGGFYNLPKKEQRKRIRNYLKKHS